MIIYNFIKNLYTHIKYVKILKNVYKKENLLKNLSDLFGSEFKMDWIGRVYTIINPYIVNGKFDENNRIFELKNNEYDDTTYIEHYIMEKLMIVREFIYTNNLFDLLTYDIKKLDEYGNYLFVMKSITFDDFWKYTKKFLILLGIIGIIILLLIKLNIF